MKKIAEDVYAYSGDGNIYLFLKPKVMVIDTSNSDDKSKVIEAISKVVPPSDVEIVAFTHFHYDHVGNHDLFPHAVFYASVEEIEDFLKNPFDSVLNHKDAEALFQVNFHKLGDSLNGLKVLVTPGHTRGSVCFLDEKKKMLFSGDTLFFNDMYGRLDLPTAKPEMMEDTLAMLKKLDYAMLCPGHDY